MLFKARNPPLLHGLTCLVQLWGPVDELGLARGSQSGVEVMVLSCRAHRRVREESGAVQCQLCMKTGGQIKDG